MPEAHRPRVSTGTPQTPNHAAGLIRLCGELSRVGRSVAKEETQAWAVVCALLWVVGRSAVELEAEAALESQFWRRAEVRVGRVGVCCSPSFWAGQVGEQDNEVETPEWDFCKAGSKLPRIRVRVCGEA